MSPETGVGTRRCVRAKHVHGDQHKAHRNIVNDWFKPGNLKAMQPRIDELAKHYVQPDQLELLQAHPELIDNAADEFVRWTSPVKHFMRTCQAPFTIRDVTFRPGDLLYLSYASANRDAEVFPEPFRLDVRRENAASHVAFGFGRHFCLGAHLARMEIRALFKELLGRLDHIELAGEPTWIKAHFVQGPKSIPISYRLR